MPRILLIDDDQALGEPLAAYFASFGLALTHELSPSAGLAPPRQGDYDAAILDAMLPDWAGFSLCIARRSASCIPRGGHRGESLAPQAGAAGSDQGLAQRGLRTGLAAGGERCRWLTRATSGRRRRGAGRGGRIGA